MGKPAGIKTGVAKYGPVTQVQINDDEGKGCDKFYTDSFTIFPGSPFFGSQAKLQSN